MKLTDMLSLFTYFSLLKIKRFLTMEKKEKEIAFSRDNFFIYFFFKLLNYRDLPRSR